MNICIVIPTFDYLKQAGARIRYARMRDELDTQGVFIHFREISELCNPMFFEHDVYIISKCYDVRCVVLSHYLKQCHKVVGVDLFDNYFSQHTDSRFSRLRYWLSSLAPQVDFAMCSTENMKSVAKQYLPTQPIHVMNDPYSIYEPELIADALDEKLSRVTQTKHLDILWFGIGDNPNFAVGISDLMGYAGSLHDLKGHGFEVSLQILTNRRALTPANLGLLRQLPIEYEIEEWSEEREEEYLKDAFLCFLPVNSQSFSVVKSLNRAIACLTHGVQILSPGFDLYQSLENFIYRSSLDIIKDVKAGLPRLRSDQMDNLSALLQQYASPQQEAKALCSFLGEMTAKHHVGLDELDELESEGQSGKNHCVLHGLNSTGDAHKFIQKLNGLSIGTPFCTAKLNFDIRIFIDKHTSQLNVAISTRTIALLSIDNEHLLDTEEPFASRFYRRVALTFFDEDEIAIFNKKFAFDVTQQPFLVLSEYSEIMSGCIQIINKLLPSTSISLSENSKLPWWIDTPAQQLEEMV
jgi:hypothetical protein